MSMETTFVSPMDDVPSPEREKMTSGLRSTHSIALDMEWAERKRSAGFFIIALRMICDTPTGMESTRSRGFGGSSLTCMAATAIGLSALNGSVPVTASYSRIPTE